MIEYTEEQGESRGTSARPSTDSDGQRSPQGQGKSNHKKYNNRHSRNKNRHRPQAEGGKVDGEAAAAPTTPSPVTAPTTPTTESTHSESRGGQHSHKSQGRGGKKNKNRGQSGREERPSAPTDKTAPTEERAPTTPTTQDSRGKKSHSHSSRRDRDRHRKNAGESEIVPHLPDDSIFGDTSFSSAPKSRSLFDDYSISIKTDDSYLDSMPLDPTLDAVFSDEPIEAPEEIDGPEIVGIRFQNGSKVYYFDPADIVFTVGQHAVVETAQGVEYGEVVIANRRVPEESVVSPLRPVIRTATAEDDAHHADNKRRQNDAYKICLTKIENHGLDMKLVEAQYTFDNSKLIFFFTSAGRVDFRELVKDLASVFRTRIELRQIGIRDESKMIGGFGVCGRKLCCASFLPNFAQVSIKMAKEQGLSLNSAKISGTCGRLMCCLRFEQETYEREIALMPPPESVVETPDGRGVVLDIFPISGSVKVKLADSDVAPKTYKLSAIRVITKASRRGDDEDETVLDSQGEADGE